MQGATLFARLQNWLQDRIGKESLVILFGDSIRALPISANMCLQISVTCISDAIAYSHVSSIDNN